MRKSTTTTAGALRPGDALRVLDGSQHTLALDGDRIIAAVEGDDSTTVVYFTEDSPADSLFEVFRPTQTVHRD